MRSARAGQLGARGCARRPRPRRPGRAGGADRSRRRASRGAWGASVSARSAVRRIDAAREPARPRLRIGDARAGPAELDHRRRRRRRRPRHRRARRARSARRARRRAHRRHRDRPGAARRRCARQPLRRGRRRAQRRRRDDRLPAGRRVGPARDADLPHRHDGGRAGLRRRRGRRGGRRPGGRRRGRRHPRRRRVRRQLAQRRARACRCEAADAGRALADAAARPASPRARSARAPAWSCFGFKGGIGTASRVVAGGHASACWCWRTSARARDLRVDGVPVGRLLGPTRRPRAAPRRPAAASRSWPPTRRCDAASSSALARRAGLGLARTGSVAHHGSGEIFLAFSTAPRRRRRDPTSELDPLFAADRGRDRGGRAQRALERRARRRPRGPGRRGAAPRRRRRTARSPPAALTPPRGRRAPCCAA